ncbi:MAG TPA: DEAD/DEAH box helicase family protein [Candidatus Olsenella pullistercoris]|uniref:DEAD/DEAH box helicase family protein n=1 Tax=Candidatus Olsenella pullistercoris TaxID=2838712 RepID=A0A9D2JDJ7_9ACTN|nr:DEAD/DEAH box helicase family protein [Candidatus Olsenella pullistercoris]
MDIKEIYEKIVSESVDTRQQGTRYERAVKWFLENDPAWSSRLEKVWMWADSPTNGGDKGDYGIDLVARDATDGTYWAIQAKCYGKNKLAEKDVATFLGFAGIHDTYQHLMVADTTTGGWTGNLAKIASGEDVSKDLIRLSLDDMLVANLEWESFAVGVEYDSAVRRVHEPRPHQRAAIDGVRETLAGNDRCSVFMACGTGKTLMALRAAEELVGDGGTVLFLAPSISLVSQSMREWSNQVRGKINPYVICSDASASSLDDESYGTLMDVPFPATTNPHTIAARFKPSPTALNVVFSTYQSIDRVHEAQELGLPGFDLCICDEAHRTTGVIDGETAFRKVHDAEYIRAVKRVYMTATPRIFGEAAKRKAKEGAVEVASMDDEDTYGPVAYRLSFGKAVSDGLLTDYKIVVMKVSENMVSSTMQRLSARDDLTLEMPDVAKFLGCWKALFDRRHGADWLVDPSAGPDEVREDGRTLRHAIAFAASIPASKALSREFQTVVDTYLATIADEAEGQDDAERADVQQLVEANRRVEVKLDHVDGTMAADERKVKLDWLAVEEGEDTCHILSNARCLAEGVDVPALDAVIYLSSRKSKVDIIQSVGRVMRRAPGKRYGYIVIPVFVPAGTDEGLALSNSKDYKVVWDVVRALRSHDERLDAVINAGNFDDTHALEQVVEVEVLDESKLKRTGKAKAGSGHRVGARAVEPGPADAPEQLSLDIDFDDIRGLARAIRAQIVKKCGTKIYWSEWTGRVAQVTAARCEQIAELVHGNAGVAESFGVFLEGIRDSLNDGFDERRAIETLAQHEVTRPIFVALFDNEEVVANNPITLGLDRALESLYAAGLPRSTDDRELAEVYASVRAQVAALTTDASRQQLVKEIYNEFFKAAFKDTSDALGIVYTPVEVVDAQLHMVQRALGREFGLSLGDRGVHILDGFAGTGTYLCRLIEDETLIPDGDLPYKYLNDLHSNEIVPLAATIMDINIEQSYHSRMGGEYVLFPGALLTDTFQMHEENDVVDHIIFTENSERIVSQREAEIRVIVGNPPYRAGDKDNTGNQNTKYPSLDARIEATYAAGSKAVLKNSLYDHYIRAFRWASDRIGDSGIVCFVSNGGWLKGEASAGVRKCFADEFSSIYVYNLRGNQRTQGEESRREGGKIFDSGSRATIAITMLVKNPASGEHGVVRYRDIGDYLTREEKLRILTEAVDADPEWAVLRPDEHGDWLEKRDDSFMQFIPMGVRSGVKKLSSGLFETWSGGYKTQRDAWTYSFSQSSVKRNTEKTIRFFNAELSRYQSSLGNLTPESFVSKDETSISWSRAFYADIKRGRLKDESKGRITKAVYRPFCIQWCRLDKQIADIPGGQTELFPFEGAENYQIGVVFGPRQFSCLMAKTVVDIQMEFNGQYFPLYWYEEVEPAPFTGLGALAPVQPSLFGDSQATLTDAEAGESSRWVRHDAITDAALAVFRKAYPDIAGDIDKLEIFFYVYGILHSPEYRERFANNLKKELPRIPLARDFGAFCRAGHRLATLHLGYEEVPAWGGLVEDGDPKNPGRTEKMTWGKAKDENGKAVKDYTVLHVAERMTIRNIPERCQEYVVNGKSALGWLVDRYQVRTDPKSGIVNDPNDYSRKPRYIVDLVESIVRVSMETLDVVESLPALDELPQTANWPIEWRQG